MILEHYDATDGARLAYHRWPVEAPRATAVYVHGIQSHAGWYEASCRRMQEAGFEVLFVDRRGSGVNEADRGHAPSYRQWLDDLAVVFEQARDRRPRAPRVLLGISWGGKPAVGVVKARPDLVDALGLLCPGLFPKVIPPLGTRLAIAVAALCAPRRRFAIPLNDPKLFTDNAERQRFIAEDPLALRKATARLLAESVRLDWYLRDAPEQIDVPTALFLAGQDRIIDNDKTLAYFERFASPQRDVKRYPDDHHTLEFARDPSAFLDDLVTWLERVAPKERKPRA